ncbi:MAG: polyprenyl synthetase family protein [Lachnospiraceae bacterium]|nr:polyprenyl synthetase family protein [Lachnospiraceae bacterium]
MDFKTELSRHVEEVELILKEQFPVVNESYSQRVVDAMKYSFFAGGKRLRPMMMLESYRLFCGEREADVKPFMTALEMIHTYSLIHDDLPAMDNDDYRRGRLTNHKQFDEATAILAGDGLLNLAFELVADSMASEENAEMLMRKSKAFRKLSNKAGIYGMIGGQMADIQAEQKTEVTKEELLFIHKNKTAALIQAALTIGAVLAGATEEQVMKMEQIGYNIGVAFQIQDDILDKIGNEELLGKPIGSDEKNQKITYVTLEGLEASDKEQKRLSGEAITLLDTLPGNNEFLSALISSLITRDR